jgi:hypothetical protein
MRCFTRAVTNCRSGVVRAYACRFPPATLARCGARGEDPSEQVEEIQMREYDGLARHDGWRTGHVSASRSRVMSMGSGSARFTLRSSRRRVGNPTSPG